MNNSPRRNQIDKLNPAEKAIHDAILAVEQAGAAPELTDVVMQLIKAKDSLSDFVDKQQSTNSDCPKGYVSDGHGGCVPDLGTP